MEMSCQVFVSISISNFFMIGKMIFMLYNQRIHQFSILGDQVDEKNKNEI